ncbi:MAG TPA: prepilin peptidase, partial [Candidatus Pacearchaeota archaeon]|nr:prepilin peptidase [Candidatus Pacearchaeota archaeon]
GLCIGSFLNVLIDRLPNEESIFGRSYCPHCRKTLKWYELVPVLSFIFLRGKCSGCKKPISWQYPIIETITGLLFLLIFNFQFSIFNEISNFNLQNILLLFCELLIVSCLVVIFMTDLKYMIVPDEIIYPAIAFSIIYQILNWHMGKLSNWYYPFFAGFGAALFFIFLILITKGKGMGFGDVKIVAFMGIFLSFPNILVALCLAFFTGALVGLILMVLHKKTMKSEIPFGCFLAPATLIVLFFGEEIVKWYLSFL